MRIAVSLAATALLAGCVSRPFSPPLPEHLQPCDNCLPGIINFARVSPVLWRGAQPDREGFKALAAAGVTTVINLRLGEENSDEPALEGTGLRAVQIPMKAWRPEPDKLRLFLSEVEAARNAGGIAYVHCQQGRDRTGYSVASYRMVMQGWTADQAIDEMFNFRFNRIWRGNPGFLRQLDAPGMRPEAAAR